MSYTISFNKPITLNMLREKTDFQFEHDEVENLWVATKDYNDYDNQADVSENMIEFKKQFVQLYIDDDDSPICMFVVRDNGFLMIREIAKAFNAMFMSDVDEDEIYYIRESSWTESDYKRCIDGIYHSVLTRYGLCVNDNGDIVDIV